VAACTLGSPLVYYALAEPSYAHTTSFLSCTALTTVALRRSRSLRSLAALGALWGLTALVRYQDAVLGVLAVPRLWDELVDARRHASRGAFRLVLFAACAFVVFLPQMLFWQRLYGRPLVFAVPTGFMHWTGAPIAAFLFSTWQGAFLWSPVLLFGTAGI